MGYGKGKGSRNWAYSNAYAGPYGSSYGGPYGHQYHGKGWKGQQNGWNTYNSYEWPSWRQPGGKGKG